MKYSFGRRNLGTKEKHCRCVSAVSSTGAEISANERISSPPCLSLLFRPVISLKFLQDPVRVEREDLIPTLGAAVAPGLPPQNFSTVSGFRSLRRAPPFANIIIFRLHADLLPHLRVKCLPALFQGCETSGEERYGNQDNMEKQVQFPHGFSPLYGAILIVLMPSSGKPDSF